MGVVDDRPQAGAPDVERLLLLVGMGMLIFSVVVSWTAGIIADVCLAVILVVLLAVVPQRLDPG